jgi:hypothetical protein
MFCRLSYTITPPLLQDCDPGTGNGLLTVLPPRRNMFSLIDQGHNKSTGEWKLNDLEALRDRLRTFAQERDWPKSWKSICSLLRLRK